MNVFSQDELKALMGKHQGLCVSIFMPTYRTGAESQQNRFASGISCAPRGKAAGGRHAPQEIKGLLEPAQALPAMSCSGEGRATDWRSFSRPICSALFASHVLWRARCRIR